MIQIFSTPRITRTRMTVAVTTALIVDAVQLLLGPLGILTFMDDVMDLVAAAVITMALGFHPLLLPTFIAELVPVVDLVPTWTGCTLAVLALRKRAENQSPPPEAPPRTDQMKRADVIEVSPPPVTEDRK